MTRNHLGASENNISIMGGHFNQWYVTQGLFVWNQHIKFWGPLGPIAMELACPFKYNVFPIVGVFYLKNITYGANFCGGFQWYLNNYVIKLLGGFCMKGILNFFRGGALCHGAFC